MTYYTHNDTNYIYFITPHPFPPKKGLFHFFPLNIYAFPLFIFLQNFWKQLLVL